MTKKQRKGKQLKRAKAPDRVIVYDYKTVTLGGFTIGAHASNMVRSGFANTITPLQKLYKKLKLIKEQHPQPFQNFAPRVNMGARKNALQPDESKVKL